MKCRSREIDHFFCYKMCHGWCTSKIYIWPALTPYLHWWFLFYPYGSWAATTSANSQSNRTVQKNQFVASIFCEHYNFNLIGRMKFRFLITVYFCYSHNEIWIAILWTEWSKLYPELSAMMRYPQCVTMKLPQSRPKLEHNFCNIRASVLCYFELITMQYASLMGHCLYVVS